MQNKRFIILSSILIGVLSIILLVLLIVLMQLNDRAKNNENKNIQSTKAEGIKAGVNKNVNDNVVEKDGRKTPQELLDEIESDSRVDEFYKKKGGKKSVELLFWDTIANVYFDKMVCDKTLNIDYNRFFNIINKEGYVEIEEDSNSPVYLGRQKIYEQADLSDYKVTVFLDAEDKVIQVGGMWYTPYDLKIIDDTQYYPEEELDPYMNSFLTFFREMYHNDAVSNQDKISYSIEALNQIDVSKNNFLKSIYNEEELESLQEYFTSITLEDIMQTNSNNDSNTQMHDFYELKYKLGDTEVSIKVVTGWYININITDINYKESDYYVNYKNLEEYCRGDKDFDQKYEVIRNELEYVNYTNAKYAFSINYPDIFSSKVEGDANDGIILHGKGGIPKMIAYGQYNVNEIQLDQEYEKELSRLENVLSSLKEDRWYEIKWQEGDLTFYKRQYIDEDIIYIFQIDYLSNKEEEFQKIIPTIVDSFHIKLETLIQ